VIKVDIGLANFGLDFHSDSMLSMISQLAIYLYVAN